jgi:phage terminase large subunit-like protein
MNARERASAEVARKERRDELVIELTRLRDDGEFEALSADDKLDLFERFCNVLLLEDRRTEMVLHAFERTILLDFFQGARETLVLIPKKNGKTTLISALILFHMLTIGDCYCVVAAASVKQAGTLYRQATGFIRRSGIGSFFTIRQGTREIRSSTDEGLIQVLAADADTADGVIPTLAIVDELHRHRSADLYHVFRDGLGPRNGQIVTISTAGDDEESPLGKMRNEAIKRFPEIKDEAYKCYRSPDGSFVLHEWSLDITEDRSDMHVVKRANPAPWHTIEALQERHDSPSTTHFQWARFACNVWYPLSDDPAIRPEEWDSLYVSASKLANGQVALGVDFGWKAKSDCTAIVPYQWHSELRQVLGEPVILEPAGDGSLLDDRAIAEALLVLNGKPFDRDTFERDLSRDNDPVSVENWADSIERATFGRSFVVTGIVFDPNQGGQQLCQQLEREHRLPFIRFDQRVAALARADGQFLESVRRKTLEHSWSKEARQHVMNAVQVPVTGGGFYFGRPKVGARKPTDALRAASMVHSVVLAADGKPKPDKSDADRGAYAFM